VHCSTPFLFAGMYIGSILVQKMDQSFFMKLTYVLLTVIRAVIIDQIKKGNHYESFHPVYVPIGVPTFHLESAEKLFHESMNLLKELSPDTKVPEKMLLSIDDLSCVS
jgi:hypothetical protein